jgi:hypothetical protein
MPRSLSKVSFALPILLAAAPGAVAAQRAPTVPMEVFAGRIQLADEVGGGDVDVAGVLAGVDVGAYAGLHGFYWRAVQTGPLAAGPLQAFGGEGQVNLNVGNGFTPFLVGGLARLDFLEADSAGADAMPEDRTMPIIGAGLRLDVGRFGLQGAVRSYLAQTEGDEEGAGSDLRHSPLFTVGAAFRLGRTGRAPRVAAVPQTNRIVRGDTVYVVQGDTSYHSGQVVSIPIPREGEIYLRYGPGSRMNGAPAAAPAVATPLDDAALERLRLRILDDLEPLLRGMLAEERAETAEMVRRELAAAAPGITPDAEARLLERIDALVALRVRDELARASLAGDSAAVTAPAPAPARVERFVPRFGALRPYLGGNPDRPRQVVGGVRLDLGPFDPARPGVRLVPEAALGVGDGGSSVMIAANVEYQASYLQVRGVPVQPYGYAGAGFLFIKDPPVNRASVEAVVNFGYGAALPVPNRDRGEFFVEHQGVDFFDLNRILVGLRF